MPGTIVRRGRSYALRLYIGKVNGKKTYRWYTHRTFAEAQAAQRELATHVLANSSGLGLAGSPRERLGAYLREWAEGQKARLAPRTVERYETFAAQVQRDALGSVLLARLSPRILEDYYRRRLEAGLSGTTVNHAHRMICKALRDAVRLDLIVQNPAAMAEAPKRTRSRPDVWSEPEVLMFLAEAEASSRYYPLYLFIVSTGERVAEALGLPWRDLDLREGAVSVTQTLQRPSDGGLLIKEPKSHKSHRAISLPPETVKVLRDLRNRQEGERRRRTVCSLGFSCLAQGCKGWHETELVFTQPNGKPLHANNIRQRDVRRICTKLGLSAKRVLHGLRHFHGSVLDSRDVPLKEIQDRMGHASAQFTLDTYVHRLRGMEDNAARAISAMLAGKVGR